MKALLLSTSLLLLAGGALCGEGRHTNVITPEAVKWVENPAFPKGIQIATSRGDPTKAGETVVQRIKFPQARGHQYIHLAIGSIMLGGRMASTVITNLTRSRDRTCKSLLLPCEESSTRSLLEAPVSVARWVNYAEIAIALGSLIQPVRIWRSGASPIEVIYLVTTAEEYHRKQKQKR